MAVVPSNLVQQFRNYVTFHLTCQKSNGKIITFLSIFNQLDFGHCSTLFDVVNKQIELQEWDWTQIEAHC